MKISKMKYKYQLFQHGVMVAQIESASEQQAEKEINHYAIMYCQDGPVQIKRFINTKTGWRKI